MWTSRLVRRSLSTLRSNGGKSFQTYDHLVVRNYRDSFQLWILELFQRDANYATYHVEGTSKAPLVTADLNGLKGDLETVGRLLLATKSEESLTPRLLRQFDTELCSRMTSASSTRDLLSCLHVLMTTVPSRARNLTAFANALVHLEQQARRSKVSPHNLVQAMYYASQLKTARAARQFQLVALHKLSDKSLEKLNTTDLGVFCVASFRSSAAVTKPPVLQLLAERLKRDIDNLTGDDSAIFVCFIKCFRLAKYHEPALLDTIASVGFERLSQLDLVAKIHLSVFFGAALYGNVQLVSAFLIHCVDEMSDKVARGLDPRLKDIDNLLWVAGSYQFEKVNARVQQSSIPSYVDSSLHRLKQDPHSTVALLLWLWTCGARLDSAIAELVNASFVRVIAESTQFKSVANLFLLLTCVQLEAPNLLAPQILKARDNRMQPKFEQYVNRRPCLKELLSFCRKNEEALELDKVRFAFHVPALYIGGIIAEFRGKPICIEVIDPTVCLTSSDRLNGRMLLKLRLLDKMSASVLTVAGSTLYDLEKFKEDLHRHCLQPHLKASDSGR